MKYDSKKQTKYPVLPEGDYPAELVEAEDATSKKSGNEMQKLTWVIQKADGGTARCWDYILEANGWSIKRYGQLAEALGESEAFDRNEFDAREHIGATVTVRLKITPAKGDYDEKNEITEYLPGEFDPGETKEVADSAIPF